MISFFVAGKPVPEGSKRGFVNKKTGRVIITSASGKHARPWRALIMDAALREYAGTPLTGPLCLDLWFYMPRPKSHFGTGKNADRLKPNAPTFHSGKPDRLKLARAVEDALTDAGIWRDDAQTAFGIVAKLYPESNSRAGVHIMIRKLTRLYRLHDDIATEARRIEREVRTGFDQETKRNVLYRENHHIHGPYRNG